MLLQGLNAAPLKTGRRYARVGLVGKFGFKSGHASFHILFRFELF